MSLSMKSFHNGKIDLKAARVMMGMKGHRASGFNIRVGACMKRSGVTPASVDGLGGRHSKIFQRQFVTCAAEAGARIGAGGRRTIGRGGIELGSY